MLLFRFHDKPHTNKTPGHWFASLRVAVKQAKKRDVKKVYLNKGLSNIKKGAKPNNRPDVMVHKRNGNVDQYEVPSRTDIPRKLLKRMQKNQKILGKKGLMKLVNIKKRKRR